MKVSILNIIKLLIISITITCCSNCKNDEYDWKQIEPGKLKIIALNKDTSKIFIDSILGNNYETKSYMVIPRGGSTYQWTSSNHFITLFQREKTPYIIDIKSNCSLDTIAWIKVNEITWGGKSAQPDSIKIVVIGYCEYNISQLLGNGFFTSKMTYYAPYNTYLTSTNDTLINHNFFNMRWKVKYKIYPDYTQKIEIVPGQYFVYNGEYVTIKGSGTYNTCKSRIVTNFAVCYLYGDTLLFGSGIDSLTLRRY